MSAREAIAAKLLLTELATKSYGSPVLSFAWPDVEFDPSGVAAFLDVSLFINTPGLTSKDVGGFVQKMGLLQITLKIAKGGGTIKPLLIQSSIIADWPRGKHLFDGPSSTKVTIYQVPYVVKPIEDATRTYYPVFVPWQVADTD